MASQGTRIKGRLVQYTNRGLAQMVKGLGVVRYTQPSTEMTVVWEGGQARLRIVGDAPVLPFGVDVDDVEVLLTVELHWPDRGSQAVDHMGGDRRCNDPNQLRLIEIEAGNE